MAPTALLLKFSFAPELPEADTNRSVAVSIGARFIVLKYKRAASLALRAKR